MSSSRLVRGAKTRMFAFVCLVSVLGAVLYVFHGTQARLAEVQTQATQCNQQKESFNAQLQVIYEYKDRLEKSLNKEKQDRIADAENHEREKTEAKEKKEKEMTEWKNKYEALVQKSKILQAQLEDMKESNDKIMTKLQNEKSDLEGALVEIKKQLDESETRFKDDTAGLKTKYIEQKEELKSCRSDLEDCKMRSAPAAEQKDYLTKQNEQLKAEVDMTKHELAQCKDKLTQTPKPPVSFGKADKIDPPETNVVDMPKLMGIKNISVTPGINPDAVGESSSLKPRDPAESKKGEDHVGLPPKKPTQESIVLLEQPKKFDDNPPPNGQAQIPGPPDSNPQLDTLNRPAVDDMNELNNIPEENAEDPVHQAEAKAQIQQPQFNGAPDANRGEEEDEQQVAQPQPGRNPDHYHGGDYDKEQAEDEDDEAEQIDYDGDRSLKDGRQRMKNRPSAGKIVESHGVMINPK